MRSAAKALGKPVEQELASGIPGEDAGDDRRFLHFNMPTLREGSRVAEVFKTLEEAWSNNARVRFRYAGKGERRVEPYYVMQHSGRYYLLARDIAAKDSGFRYFALDQIATPIARIGTFTPRAVPDEYRGEDAIGWIHGTKMQDVSVWLSPQLAPSATSRTWQRAQRVETHSDGSATLTFTVSDPDEVIRWSLGFGVQARIVAPQSAVERAREIARAIADAYGPP
jgi:predicted DNA-binding transcriptional regulator YafY